MVSAKRKPEDAVVKQSNKRPRSNSASKGGTTTAEQEQNKTPKPKPVSILTKEQPAFPRGGASLLTPLERKQIRAKAAQDADTEHKPSQDLFSDRNARADIGSDEDDIPREKLPEKKRERKHRKDKKQSVSSASGTNPEVRIGGLSYKRITAGSLILGQITSISPRALTVALPNNLVGYVPLTAISPQLSEKIQGLLGQDDEENNDSESDRDEEEDIALPGYFQLHQYLRVAVTSTEQDRVGSKAPARKRIEMSVEPALTNIGLDQSNLVAGAVVQVSVSSVEDHGLVVDLALEDGKVRGFIPKKQLPNGRSLSTIKVGAVLLCHVLEMSSNNKVVKLSADLTKAPILKSAPSVDTFLPGTKAEILISAVTDAGISGKIMGMLDATADVVHSGSFRDRQAFLAKYEVGKKISGRLICNFPLSDVKKLGFSLLDNVVDLRDLNEAAHEDSGRLALSSTIDGASVIRVEPGLGVYLQLDQDNIGFAHVSRLSDKKLDTLSETSGPFKLGSEHKVRVLEYNPMDNLYILSAQKSVLERPFLRFDDIPLGAVVQGTIEKLIVGPKGVQGLLVTLGEGLVGLVPQIHMSDVDLKHPEKKFREGQAVTARVLSIDPTRRRLRLSLKKALVNNDQKPWLRFEDIESGDSTVGTLTKVDRLGAVVRFYGPVRGFLPVSEMSEAYIKDATEHFRIGQVVSVNAISINASERRLTVSCRDINASTASIESTLAALQPGTLTNGTVFEKSQNDVLLRLEGSDAIARLPLDHIADGSLKKRESAISKIRVGQKLENVLILQVLAKRRLVLISNKQSLVQAAQNGTLLRSYEQLQPNAVVTGFVRNITEDGVFVGFGAGITGLITKAQVPVEAEEQPDFGMVKLQPITAKVLSIDYRGATPRFWLTMREAPAAESNISDGAEAQADFPKLVDPVDESLKTLKDLSVGKLTKAKIVSVKETQINVELAKDVQGRIDVSEVFDEWKDIKDRKKPLRQFSPKQELPVRVLGAHDTRNHRFLPLTHRKGKNTVFELTCKPSSVSGPEQARLTLQDMRVGSTWLAFINNISDECVWVNISPTIRGRIRAIDISDDLSLAANLAHNFPLGSALRVRVLNVDTEKGHLDLTGRSDGTASSLTFANISIGLVLPGRVTKTTDHNIVVQLSDQVVGVVELIDMADDYVEVNPGKYQKNDVLRVCVVNVDAPNKKVSLSTRPSKVLSSSLAVTDPEITSIEQIAVNDIVRGFISNVADKGVFVTLGHGITAFVRVSNLSDSYLKEWKDHFQRDQLVRGRVIMVDKDSGHVQISLKESALKPDYKAPLTFNDLKVGDIVTAKVVKVESFGVFILVDNSENVRGLCHRSEIAEQRVEDVGKLFNEGDKVKAKVLKIDTAKRRINFGMKASYFGDGAEDAESDSQSEDEAEEGGAHLDQELGDSEDDEEAGSQDSEHSEDADENLEEESQESEDHEEEGDVLGDATKPANSKGLSVGGFDWYGISEPARNKRPAEASDSEAEDSSKASKKRKKRAQIQVDRTADLDVDGPQSVDDFERLLLGEPDSSLLWLQYMAFHLDLGDADQARQIGERALKAISLGQEEEKLNVWVALLNLENAYGDDESIDAIFKRACEYNDPQDIYSRLTSIYIQSGKHDKADDMFQRMLKKFTQDPKMWVNYAQFLFDSVGDAEKGRALLPRALQTLPRFTHFDVTLKFAQLEFKSSHGLAERGRTIFEGLISSFPKRVDLYNVLLDLELKLGEENAEQVRGLFERIFGGKLKPKQAKYFFKRWMEFEEREGDERRVEEVKARAAKWIRDAGK
ncbi:rRNA biogenesis protein rrp5 [Fonsecaea pedrosoi]|nr:rRNA biogenesis protein rrp5 [Fonsecaea pedrosoi]